MPDECFTVSADEEPPEYDVTERLRQLNAELAQDPTPIDDDRERAIKFQEDPVSLVVPPADYSDTEDEPVAVAKQQQNTDAMETESPAAAAAAESMDNMDTPQTLQQENEVSETHQYVEGGGDQLDTEEQAEEQAKEQAEEEEEEEERRWSGDAGERRGSGGSEGKKTSSGNEDVHRTLSDNHDYEEAVQSDGEGGEEITRTAEANANKQDTDNEKEEQEDDNDEEKVVIERNGKFEYVSAKNMTAEEREMYGIEAKEEEEEKEHKPRPPDGPRPSTANGGTAAQRRNRAGPRSNSAMGQSSDTGTHDEFTYQSPYAMSADERKRRAKEKREEEKNKQEAEREKKTQEERDQADADDAFQAWLKIKRREAQEKRKQDEENRKKGHGEKKAKEVCRSVADCCFVDDCGLALCFIWFVYFLWLYRCHST